MNKLALSIAVTVALGLSGCGDSLDDIKQEVGDDNVKPFSRVVFDPSNSKVSVPNDLLFLGTQDGTLTTDAGATPDYTNPQVALGALDGWSTQNPYSITLEFPSGTELDKTTIRPDSVRVFEVLMGDPASADEECKTVARGRACKVVAELTFGQDFVAGEKGGNIAVIPLKPFKPATTYITALTSVLADKNGQDIAPSTTYELVKQDYDTAPLGSEAQINLQLVVNSYEDALAEFGVDTETVIYTAAMTTQSTDVVLNAVKQVLATSAAQRPLMVQAQGYNAGQALMGAGLITDPTSEAYLVASTAQVYGGTVTLPYYSAVPTEENPLAPLTGRWLAQYDSPVTLLGAIQAGLLDPAALGLTPEEAQDPTNLFGFDLGIDKARHITKYNPVPKVNNLSTVPVLMTMPDLAQVNVLRAAQNLPAMTMPAGGWPVVIFQHGITGEKENALAIAGSLAMAGYAMVAIDHMLHGARGFEVDDPADEDTKTIVINASDNSATDYMNLQSLLTTRDNVRQSISDILAVRAALNVSNVAQTGMINPTKVAFIGHSLGGITGTAAVAMANTPVQSASLTSEQKAAIDNLYKVETATLAMPGGAIANFLLDSGAFGALIRASVILGSENVKTGFVTHLAPTPCHALIADKMSYTGCASQYVDAYLALLAGGTKEEKQTYAAIQTSIAQFSFAAQTVVDSGDPNNYAQHMVTTETPTYVIAVVGNGNENLPDQVIPNGYYNPMDALTAEKMPLAGTLPLARLLDAQVLNNVPGIYPLNSNNALARFNAGDHSSILSPEANADVTKEMQKQTASFVASKGAVIQVSEGALLVPAN